MDTRTNILLHRIPRLFPDNQISDLKEKCKQSWTDCRPYEMTTETNFFSAFKPDFGEFTDNYCYIDRVRSKVFLFAHYLIYLKVNIKWIRGHVF